MKRSSQYWVWLLADVSLERATSVLPLLGFPTVDHAVVQRSIDATGEQLKLNTTELKALGETISAGLRRELGDAGKSVEIWLQSFCFTDEASRPDLFYWDTRFLDLFVVEPAPMPESVDPSLWAALLAAYRGIKPNPAYPWTKAFSQAAEVIITHQTIAKAIDTARSTPLSRHDLDIYMRFGWNDSGINQGLASLEIGARLSATRLFWQAIAEHVSASSLEALAYERDMAMWVVAANPADFLLEAQRYGITPEQMAADIFPKPVSPPKLKCLLEN